MLRPNSSIHSFTPRHVPGIDGLLFFYTSIAFLASFSFSGAHASFPGEKTKSRSNIRKRPFLQALAATKREEAFCYDEQFYAELNNPLQKRS